MGLSAVACGGEEPAGGSSVDPSEAAGQVGVAPEVLAAAQEEGSLTWYCSQPIVACERVRDGFQAAFPVTVDVVPLGAAIVATRVSAEIEANNVEADVIQVTNTVFLQDAADAAWLVEYDAAAMPALAEWPEEFVFGDAEAATAVGVGVLPLGIGYNTQLVPEGDAPQDWEDLLDPRFQGKVAITAPTVTGTIAQLQLWQDSYGDDFIRRFADQVSSLPDNAAPAAQDLAAGEVSIALPIPSLVVDPLTEAGAPIELVIPELSTGVTSYVAAVNDAPHPNAASLFMAYLMSPAGQEAINQGISSPLGDSIPGTFPLPAQFQGQELVDRALANRDELAALLTD